jgi:hypothetical protein
MVISATVHLATDAVITRNPIWRVGWHSCRHFRSHPDDDSHRGRGGCGKSVRETMEDFRSCPWSAEG